MSLSGKTCWTGAKLGRSFYPNNALASHPTGFTSTKSKVSGQSLSKSSIDAAPPWTSKSRRCRRKYSKRKKQLTAKSRRSRSNGVTIDLKKRPIDLRSQVPRLKRQLTRSPCWVRKLSRRSKNSFAFVKLKNCWTWSWVTHITWIISKKTTQTCFKSGRRSKKFGQ